MGDLRIAK